jgi:hypothetical protein
MQVLDCDLLAEAKLLVERGANLFIKDSEGDLIIDIDAPNSLQVLLHAKELRWSAIKDFILLAKACQSPARVQIANLSTTIYDDDATVIFAQIRSARLAASIFAILGLLRLVGSYIIRSDIIVRDKSIPKPPDAVKLRVEAALNAAAD